MKDLRKTIVITSLVVVGFIMPARAEMATTAEALTVANNWLNLIIQKKGCWGDANSAFVEDIEEFKRGQRRLGYFCRVQPQGYIVISLHKTLAPVKAYSEVGSLAPDCDVGMTDLIKGGMERILDRIEDIVGKIESASIEDLQNTLEINYRGAWDELQGDGVSFQQKLNSDVIAMNYQEGDWLLSTSWTQGNPYNRQCPPDEGCAHTVVGCVALGTAQIMRYWNWPPYGEGERHGASFGDRYDWVNMPDSISGSSPSIQINAVAELCYEVGAAEDNHWGCDGTGTQYYEVQDALEDYFRYSTHGHWHERYDDETAVEWFNRFKAQLNANRPVQYCVPDHSIVCDGWRETDLGGGAILREYHMNYGWAGGVIGPSHPKYCSDWDSYTNSNVWYTLDALPCSDLGDERMLEDVRPVTALGSSLSGSYSRDALFPYRYFDRDAAGSSATFNAGQYLQFLPGITVTGTSTTGGYIRILGTSSNNTLLFTRGNESQGVRIYDGGIRLYQNGNIKFD